MMRETKCLFVEVASKEIRFLYWEKGFWNKSSRFSFQSIPYECNVPDEDNKRDLRSLIEILKNYRLNVCGKKRLQVYLLIPFQNGLIRESRLPWVIKNDRDSAVKYYLQHEIPGLADDLVYNYQVIEEKEKQYLNIRVIAARKDVISLYADCVKQAGYELRGIEYSVSAVGEILNFQSEKRILCLQELKENRIQLVYYKNSHPEVIREMVINQYDITKYHIYLGLRDYEIPLDLIITDNGDQAEAISNAFIEAGLVKNKISTLSSDPTDDDEVKKYGFPSYALFGEMYRVQDKKNINFFKSFMHSTKIKAMTMLMGGFLVVLIMMGSLLWYPQFLDYLHIQQEITTLQNDYKNLQNEESMATLTEWKKAQEITRINIAQIQKLVMTFEDDVNVTRLDYKQNTLYLWAECTDELSITKTIGNLLIEGWKEPVLVDYRYGKQKTTFCLSVKR